MKKLIKYRLISGYKYIGGREDFALTPYLFLFTAKGVVSKTYGLGICWGFWSAFIALGINIPERCPRFINLSKK